MIHELKYTDTITTECNVRLHAQKMIRGVHISAEGKKQVVAEEAIPDDIDEKEAIARFLCKHFSSDPRVDFCSVVTNYSLFPLINSDNGYVVSSEEWND